MRAKLLILLGVLAIGMALTAPAQAAFGLKELDVVFLEEDGTTASEAGSHPFAFTTTFGVNTAVVPEAYENPETKELEDGEVPEGEIKNLDVFQIPGLVGSQTAVPRCSSADFNTRVEGRPECPDSTAVGWVAVKAEFEVFPPGVNEYVHVPVYNLVPSPGQAAKLGFVALNVPIVIDVGVNDEPPYNLVGHVRYTPQALLFYGSKLTIWGNPANPAHDSLRGDCIGEPVESTPAPVSLGKCPVSVPEAPFLTLPRACEGPLGTTFTADSWQNPGVFTSPLSIFTHDESIPPNPQGMTSCSNLGFGPTIEARPSATSAESPAGIEVSLEVKDEGLTSPTGRAQSDIEKVELTLPEGVTANPSAAEGLGVCTKAQYDAAALGGPSCPEASKLGNVEVKSPLLEETLTGSLYLASQDDNPFGSLIAFYMLIESEPNGIFIKQAGKVEPDPETGQLVSTVDDIPQLPFSRFTLRFREGPRAPLTTPPLCGTYVSKAILYPRSGNGPVESNSTFKVTSGPGAGPCPAGGLPPFAPGFEAGSVNNNAGSYSPFYMRLTRRDGEQDMTRFDSILPPGVVGKIAGVPACSDAALAVAKAKSGRSELASPSCPAASRIGRVLVGAGVGPALTYVPGTIYLAGPYGGAPLSIAVITPAVAGPFDVGTVVVREALNLNPSTGEVEVDGAASDPIPHILRGIPLKLRDLRVYVDRPEFTLNPTSCDEESVRATLFGSAANLFSPADDVAAPLAARYQAAGCQALKFKPRLTLQLKGQMKRSGNPALSSVVRPRPGEANIGKAVVLLPKTMFIDNAHVNNPCTREQFAAEACPKKSILGTARAFTPLLDSPLEGKVYFRSNGGARDLPDIVADLRGQFRIVLVGFIDAVNGRVRTRFVTVPDAPVSKFKISLYGGKKGLVENTTNICRQKPRFTAKLTGQNGKVSKTRPRIGLSSCGKKK